MCGRYRLRVCRSSHSRKKATTKVIINLLRLTLNATLLSTCQHYVFRSEVLRVLEHKRISTSTRTCQLSTKFVWYLGRFSQPRLFALVPPNLYRFSQLRLSATILPILYGTWAGVRKCRYLPLYHKILHPCELCIWLLECYLKHGCCFHGIHTCFQARGLLIDYHYERAVDLLVGFLKSTEVGAREGAKERELE